AVRFAIALFLLTQSCTRNESRSWHEEDGYRWAKLSVPWSGHPGFKQLPEAETGIGFMNKVTKEEVSQNRIILNGSGVALGDIDGDDLTDIYFCRIDGSNVLYRNLGNWQFEDVTDSAGVACPDQYSTGAAFADIDGDTDLDLLVTSVEGPNACFLNDGQGNFKNITDASGISSATGASTMALSDIDGDGDLDLYIANYKIKSAKDVWDEGRLVFDFIVQKNKNSYRIAPEFQDDFVLDIRGNMVLYLETGEPDMLFLNDGKGRFDRVSMTDGRFLNEDGVPEGELKDWGLMARFQDIDNDGDPDLYVCNDFESPDRIWLNDGTGHFQAIPRLAIRNSSNSAMAVDFSDIDRDGDQDFMVTDMLSLSHRLRMTQRNTEVPYAHPVGLIDNRPQYMKNTVFLNRGDNTYAEIGQFSGLRASDWSWSNLFVDVDLDGYEDILIATGHYYDAQDFDAMRQAQARIKLSADAIKHFHTRSSTPEIDRLSTVFMFPKLKLLNVAFRNRGDLTFQEVSKHWGFDSEDISHGIALGDLDNDGDLDVVMNRLEAPAGVYRNETAASRIAVRLRGQPPNSQGIGAKIKVLGGPVMQTKEVIAAGTYLSSSETLYVFASNGGDPMSIEVTWRSGKVTTIRDIKPNRIYEIYESTTKNDVHSQPDTVLSKPIFEDVSHLIKHIHHETLFDDFKRQPLLTKRLSQSGPGIAWYDMDSDGDDDLIIGSGEGGDLAYFENNDEKGFLKGHLNIHADFEQTAVLGWSQEKGKASFLVGNSNYEDPKRGDSFISAYDFREIQHGAETELPVGPSVPGPISMADYDGDGDLDLFVGGRTIPGRYPEPATSILYKNQDGRFRIDATNEERFKDLGLVSGAVFSDLDGDAKPELILAVEWGPVRVFHNENGIFTDATQA
ncbi:MAG: FG-GAP-like repeat-containing protein, partial [bacterium]